MTERFSKATLAGHLTRRIDYLGKEWNFDPGNGWNQVKGKGEEANRAYGEWECARRLMERFDLWNHTPEEVAK